MAFQLQCQSIENKQSYGSILDTDGRPEWSFTATKTSAIFSLPRNSGSYAVLTTATWLVSKMRSKLTGIELQKKDQWDGTDIEPTYQRKTDKTTPLTEDDEYEGYLKSYREGDKFS